MNINLDYIKEMRTQSWDAYFECLDLIENIHKFGSEIDKLRLKSLTKQLSKLAEKSKYYDSIYAILYDPLYTLCP